MGRTFLNSEHNKAPVNEFKNSFLFSYIHRMSQAPLPAFQLKSGNQEHTEPITFSQINYNVSPFSITDSKHRLDLWILTAICMQIRFTPFHSGSNLNCPITSTTLNSNRFRSTPTPKPIILSRSASGEPIPSSLPTDYSSQAISYSIGTEAFLTYPPSDLSQGFLTRPPPISAYIICLTLKC